MINIYQIFIFFTASLLSTYVSSSELTSNNNFTQNQYAVDKNDLSKKTFEIEMDAFLIVKDIKNGSIEEFISALGINQEKAESKNGIYSLISSKPDYIKGDQISEEFLENNSIDFSIHRKLILKEDTGDYKNFYERDMAGSKFADFTVRDNREKFELSYSFYLNKHTANNIESDEPSLDNLSKNLSIFFGSALLDKSKSIVIAGIPYPYPTNGSSTIEMTSNYLRIRNYKPDTEGKYANLIAAIILVPSEYFMNIR